MRLRGSRKQAGSIQVQSPRLVHTAHTASGSPAVYVFNNEADNGYMILSADDVAYPVLGYADSGSFDAGNMPPAMKWWLSEYSRQIEYASAHQLQAGESAAESAVLAASRAGRESIAPQLATDWDQTSPYNDQCPLSGTVRTYTGCVATAMAQVMKYWNYPERGQGKISYTATTLEKKLSLDFSLKALEWDKMLDAYYPGQYTEEQAEAVAYLMKACGYAVKMDYGTDSSGALAMMIRNGLVKYFNYDGNAEYTLRMYHSSSDWEQMIYDNLKNVGPVLYGGASTIGGGHSFVCDGYDGDGYFHFNWGWTGMSNGYFSLDALNPDALGSGGGSGGGYNFTQDAVLGIQPPTGKPVVESPDAMTSMGSLTASIASDSLKFDLAVQQGAMWVNYNPTVMRVKFGAEFAPQTGGEPVYADVSDRRWEFKIGYGTSPSIMKPAVYLPSLGLADGTYKVSLATLAVEEDDAEWVPCKTLYGYQSYVIVTKKGDEYTVESLKTPELKIVGGGFIGDVYYGCTTRLSVEVENPSDIELSGGFAPVLSDGQQLAFLGESVLLTVPPHTTVTHEWVTDLYVLQQYLSITTPTRFYMSYMDEGTYKVFTDDYLKPVTVNPNPGVPSISLEGSPVVADANKRYKVIGNQRVVIYEVNSPGDMEVTANVLLENGYFAYTMLACLAQESEAVPGSVEVVAYGGRAVFMDAENNTHDFAATISYPQMEPDKMYNLVLAYQAGSGMYPIDGGSPAFVCLSTSGVENVTADETSISIVNIDGSVHASSPAGITRLSAYNLNGSAVGGQAVICGNTASLSLEGAPQGIVIVTALDGAGNTRTIKLAR